MAKKALTKEQKSGLKKGQAKMDKAVEWQRRGPSKKVTVIKYGRNIKDAPVWKEK